MTPEVQWRSGLPEDYGLGQRQYDLALAALQAAEPWIYAAAVLAGGCLAFIMHQWAAFLVAVPVYLIGMIPLKRARAAASTAWQAEREAWLRQFE